VTARPPRGIAPPRARPKRRGREPLPSLDTRDLPDALAGIEATGDVEKDADATLTALTEGYRAEERQQRAKVKRNNDGAFYFVIVCSSHEEALALQRGLLNQAVANLVEYVDGREIAARQGIELPAEDGWEPQKPKPVSGGLAKIGIIEK
jgi:hypothetical protein